MTNPSLRVPWPVVERALENAEAVAGLLPRRPLELPSTLTTSEFENIRVVTTTRARFPREPMFRSVL